MKLSTRLLYFTTISGLGFSFISSSLLAAEPEPSEKTQGSERAFASPEEAVKVLRAAVETNDKTALNKIFGPEFRELATGDEVQDANNHRHFAVALAEGCNLVKEGESKIILEVGTNGWPMPIPLVMADGQWHFDTAAGKEEAINRHIGKDELCAIGVCRAYVRAQRQYSGLNQPATYAQKFKSSPGKKDGLYWTVSDTETPSPFGPLVAEAHAEGYEGHRGDRPHPFHGYYFRVLTRQGKDAPGGKMNYVTHDGMTVGFALVAYPEHWDRSGVMTFIVNQDGTVFQRNLGEKTLRIGKTMREYDPNAEWTQVQDEGLPNAVSEK